MPARNYLYEHIRNPKNHDVRRVLLPIGKDRLHFSYRGCRGGWNDVASIICCKEFAGVTWLPDSNVAILRGAEPVWDALQLMGTVRSRTTTELSGVVESELKEMLEAPHERNRLRAAIIRNGLDRGRWIRHSPVDMSKNEVIAINGYTHLIGFRRSLAIPQEDGKTILGTSAKQKDLAMNEIISKLGPRNVALARKGRDEYTAKGAINLNDEINVVSSVVRSIKVRSPMYIITADTDYIEIFYKLQRFIDTHYRAWLYAGMLANGVFGGGKLANADVSDMFEGQLRLYPRYTAELSEVLPRFYEPVEFGVICVKADGRLEIASFGFVVEMLKMIAVRGETNGLNTNLFGGKNLHISLGPIIHRIGQMSAGLGVDRVGKFETNGINSRLAVLDLEHAITCFESHCA